MKYIIIVIFSLIVFDKAISEEIVSSKDEQSAQDLVSVISQIKLNKYIYITTTDQSHMSGKFIKVLHNIVYLENRNDELSVDVSNIQKISLKKSNIGEYGVGGCMVGAGFGLMISTYMISKFDDNDANRLKVSTGSALIGGVLGGGLGLIIGKLGEKEETIYSKTDRENEMKLLITPSLEDDIYLSLTITF